MTDPITPKPTEPDLLAEPPKPQADPTLLDPEPPKPVVPDTYTDFTLPEGFTLDDATKTEMAATFKELGLTQEGAQKLVDLHTKRLAASIEGQSAAAMQMRNDWKNDAVKNPTIGTGTAIKPEVLQTIGRAIEGLGPTLAPKFREAMNISGVGNNPAFIEAFYALARERTEGRPLAAPKPAAVSDPSRPQSKAHALYPNNP